MRVSLDPRDLAQRLPGDPSVLAGKTSSPTEHHRAAGQYATARGDRARRARPVATLWAVSLAGLGWAGKPKPWATVWPITVRPGFSIFHFRLLFHKFK
jgi:hypothetical protein